MSPSAITATTNGVLILDNWAVKGSDQGLDVVELGAVNRVNNGKGCHIKILAALLFCQYSFL